MKKLVIVLGAGASHSQNPDPKQRDNQNYRPPLAKEIFSTIGSFADILHKYPPAETLASAINAQLRQNREGVGLEQILKQYEERLSNGEDSPITRQFLHIPPYLNDLFGEISQHFTYQPDEYNILVGSSLDKTDHVLFLTMNYDTLLELPLSQSSHEAIDFSKHKDYISDPKWTLAKIHGSTNWYRAFNSFQVVHNSEDYVRNLKQQSINLPLGDEIVMFPIPGHQKIVDGATPLYPAITVPVDGKYDLNCPPEILSKAKEFLADCNNYLIIGTSGRDQDLLDLLKDNAKGGKILIVGREEDHTIKARENFMQHIPQFTNFDKYFHKRGFSQFIDDGKLESFLNTLI